MQKVLRRVLRQAGAEGTEGEAKAEETDKKEGDEPDKGDKKEGYKGKKEDKKAPTEKK